MFDLLCEREIYIWKDEVGSEESCERERRFQVPTYSHSTWDRGKESWILFFFYKGKFNSLVMWR
jgi:hypothetical protein